MKEKFLQINKPINSFICKYGISYILLFIISLCIPSFFALVKGNVLNISNLLLYIIEFLLIIINTDLIILNIINKNFKYEHIFLSLVIPLGLLYAILLLPNYVPDEAAHSYRVYDLSQGNIITRKNNDNSPKIEVVSDLVKTSEVNSYKDLGKTITAKTDYNDTVLIGSDGGGAAFYPFMAYSFSAISMKVCQLLGINILISYYLARIVAFLLSIVLIYYAIKIIPFGKIILLFYSFNPMFMQQLTSLSADNIINSLSLIFIAILLYMINVNSKLDKKHQVLVALITISIAILKYIYLPLTFLLLLLVNKKDKISNRKIYLLLGISIILSILFFLLPTTYVSHSSYATEVAVDSSKQISYILANPISYIVTLFRSTYSNSGFYFFTLFGSQLGHLNIMVNEIVIIIYAYILLFTPFLEETKLSLTRKQKICFLAVIFIIYILIETGLYLYWTNVGAQIIEGVQGRYFIPIFFMIPLMLISNQNKLKYKYKKLFICLAVLIINLISILSIIKFFNY